MSTLTSRPPQSILAMLARHASSTPDRRAITSSMESFTYREITDQARRAARALTSSGVGSGDRFAVLTRNSATMMELTFAASAIGAVLVPLNFRLAPAEIATVVVDSGATLVFVEDEWRPLLADLPSSISTVRVADSAQADEYRTWRDEASTADQPTEPGRVLGWVLDHAPGLDAVVLQMYTTGTTGRPKGVMITEGNLVAMMSMIGEVFPLSAASRYLALLPMFHVSGGGTPLAVLAAGGEVFLSSGTSAAATLDDLSSWKITHANLVPSLITALLADPAVRETDLSHLEVVMYGAAPSTGTTIAEAMRLLPTCWFLHGYGLTECTGGVAFAEPHRWGDLDDAPGSVGKPVANCRFRIVDPSNVADVADGSTGEILVHSPQNSIGYWNRPDETAHLFVDGEWLRTGDIGLIDATGRLYLKDRLKDMIISGGENVYSAEVENVIGSHPAVLEVAVYGRPSEQWGETVVATLTIRPGHTATASQIIDYTRARLAHYKCPKSVSIVAELPKSNGKILKRILRETDCSLPSTPGATAPS